MKRSYWLLLVLFLMALLLFSPFQARAYPVTDTQKLQQAWRLAQTVGRFHYQTDVIQTTHPAITLRNANRHAKTKQFQVAGEMDLPNNRMAVQIQTNRAGQSQVIDLKVEAGQAYGRLNAQADWTPIDRSTDLFAPGGDPLGFLVATENVDETGDWRREPTEQSPVSSLQSDNLLDKVLPADYRASLTRYHFDLNGVKYAEFMRAQMEESLRRQGELPNGMKLDLVRQYVDMTGSGEIWVDEDGLPVRQLIQLQFPPEGANGEWVEATVTTAFRQWQPSPVATLTTLWQQPAQMPRLLLNGVGITPWALQEAGIVLLLCLVIGSLAGLIIYYRRSRLLYTSVILSLIGSLLAVPVFNAQQVYAFSERQERKAAATQAEKATQDQLETSFADQNGWNFDPQRNPLHTTTDIGSNGLVDTQHELRIKNYELRNALFATSCDMATDSDCDDDGLSNEAEVNKLGTDPYAVDSDNDYISDKVEVQGFTFGGKQWYLDPLNPDSNGDGLLDSLECPGVSDINLQTDAIDSSFVSRTCLNSDSATTNSDLVPDVFDFDNDGDGVPDTVDDSPYTVVGNTSTGLTDSKLNFNLTFTGANKPIYVDFTVRPVDADHLWYTNNVLDWPNNDSTGQITRVFDTTYADTDSYSSLSKSANGDMLLIPLLEFEIAYDAANPSAGLPIASGYSATDIHDYSDLAWLDTDALDELGISVNEGEDGQSLLLWVPLSLAQDDVGDTPVAWEGRMLYRPVTGLSNLGQDQSVRLVWMVQALVDTCDVSTSSTSLTSAELVEAWCADKAHWTTGTSVIQTYYDDFMLTGLSVREDHGAKVAMIAEPKNVGNSSYDDRLWHLADSLESAFLGAEGKADSSRLGVADIATYAATWGLSGLTINTYTLDNQLDLASVASTYSTDLLNSAFGSATIGDSASLLFAGEETARTAALTDAATSISGNTVKLTLTGATLATQANLRWAPYQYAGAGVWDTLELATYLATLDSALQSVFTNSQIDLLVDNEAVTDYTLLRAGASGLAQNYYLSLFSGLSKTVAEDGNRFSSTALGDYTLGSTEPATVIVKALLAEIQGYYAELAVVDGAATTSDMTAANSLAASFATSLAAILAALGNVAQGNVTTALSLALSELANYYKTTNVATTQFTDVGSITAAAWSSTVAYAGSLATGLDFLYGVVSAGMAAYTIIWGVRAFNAYSSYMALANFTHFQPGASNPTAAFTYAAKADSVVKTNVAWAVVTFVITVAIIWTLFALGKYDNHLQRNAAIVKAVADTIVALIMAVIAAIPVFGWIIVGVVSLISALMMIVCAAVGVESGSDVDRWVCGGLTGALSQAIVYAIYDQYIVPDLNDSDRLSIALNTPTLSQKLDDSGYLAGNQLTVSATVTNTISKAQPTGLGSKEHFGYDLDDLLKKSTFAYTLQSSKTDRHASLKAGALDWTDKTEVFYPSVTIDFDSPGLNQNLPLYLTESFVAPALECWGFLIQVCGRSDYKDSFHTYLGEDIVFDILPATLDEFYALTLVKNNSYRLGWDSQFPTLIDADGDGLVSKAKGGADPDDQHWDTDSDGLSDFWELENGFDPEYNDYDGDGLYDYWEAFYNTDPHLADSDSDGLTDSEELFHSGSQNASVKDSSTWSGGWTFVYAYSGSTKLQTRVNADPLDYDSDDDTIGDRLEYVYGYNPNLASVLNVLSLDAEVSSDVIAPAGTIAYTATVKNELDNRVANGLLQAEFPVDTVQKTQVMATLYPQDATTINGIVTAPTVSTTTATSLTLRAGAIIDEVDTGRVLWLHLNENANVSTFDDDAQSENGPHDATCTAANGVCPGANGSFLNFDGSNDLLTISHDDEFNLTNFTASLWVKLDTIKAQTFLAKGTTGLTIGTTSFGQAYASLRLNDCATTVTVRSSALLVTGSWHNLVATYNGTTLAFYLNGVSAGSASAASLCTNSSPLTLGSSNGGNYFDGQMDEVELYTEGKSAAEVATLAQKPVFYLSGYRSPANSGYTSNDESDYRAVTVACVASASNNFTCPSEAVGIAGDSFVFNQSHGLQVYGSDLLDLDAVDGSFSMALWLYPESGYTPDDNHLNNYGQMILGNDDNGWQKAYPSLYIKGNKLIVRFGHADGNGYCEATSGDIFSYNNWQYLTVTFDGSQFKAYIGDTLKSTFSGSNCAGQSLYATTSFYIGNGRSPALYFTQLEADNDPQNDEAFLWSDETLLNNGYGVQSLIWESVDHDIDSNDTLAINKWAYNTDSNFSFILCNEDASATQGCTGKNDYITLDGSTTKTVNYYDSLGTKQVRIYNAHGDGSGDRHTWHGWLSYKLYNNAFKGQLDEIKLYRTALSADAVSAAYNGSVQSLEVTFDEAPGQDIFSDSSGNAYDATCSTTACPDSGIPGRDNQAGRFDGGVADDDGTDGVGDYLKLENTDLLGLKDSSFTVLAWVKPDSLTGDRAILGTDGNQPQKGLHLILRNGKPYFGFFNMDTAGSSTIATDQWTHLAWRYDKDNLTQSLYVNGVLDAQGAGKASFLGTGPVYLGRALGGNYFDGLIDHLVIVKEALTDDEIADVMQEAPTLNLHLDEDLNATRFVNDSLYGNDATCSGSACPQAGAKGQMREAPVFDGNDLLTTNLTGYVADPRNISVAFWVKPTQTKSTVQYLYQSNPFNLFLKANSTDLGVDVGYSSNNSTCSVGSTADLSVSLQKNQWNHVVVTLASTDTSYTKKGTLTVYINGAAQSATTKTYTCPALTTINLGQSFEGSLDELLLYNSVLADETVQSLYAYQSAWYDLSYQQLITIDADDPLLSIEMSADYLDYQAYWFTFSAVDTGSSVATVQVKLTKPDNSVTTGYATASADSTANNAWLYEFTPTSSGRYVIEVTATDAVGNSSSASKTFYIDDTAPTITLDSALTSAILTTTTGVATHDLALTGSVSDPGSPASGVVTNTVSVDLLDHQDVSVSGSQYATVSGSAWQVDYPFTTQPYGQYSATLRAADLAGNTITTTVGPLNLDDLGPTADIALSSSVISESVGTLSGVVTDIPYPSEDRARYLHFEEESSATTFVDSTSNGVIVTCTDCPTAGATGQSGRAATFDGVNDRLTLSAPFDPAASKFTAATWFKVADLTTPHTLLAQANGAGAGRAWLLVTTAGTLASDLGGSRLSSVDSVTAGQWHHAALTYDGTTLSLYLDGTLTAQADLSLESSDGELVLGADGTQTQDFFAGLLDETVIYHRALSAEELYDIAHPLATTVAGASIRFRHAADGDQGEGEGSWTPVTLDTSNATFTTWQYPLPAGLEGPYKIDLKATDSIGNSSYIPGVWSGDIDTQAPRISFSYTLLSDTYMQVECLADDYNVTLDGWECPAARVSEVPEDDAWFLDLFDPYTRTTSLQSPLATLVRAGNVSGTLNVCDEVGHCSSQTIASPSVTAEASAIVTPSGATTYNGLDPIALAGYVRSTNDVRAVDVTIDGVTIYSFTWSSGITEATWSTVWTPPSFGAYILEATMTNGLGQAISDPVDTVLTVVAPELTVDKTVTPSSRLRTGDAITYTVVFANSGDATAASVFLSDTLPSAVTGSDLNTILDLASGESVTYTIPAVVAAGDAFTVTNSALISHTWQQRTASASFTRCDDLLVTNANDSGVGSLRQAISDACTDDAVIRFADDFNIYLNSTLSINKGVTIDGEDHTIVLSGDTSNNGSRDVQVLSIGASGVVTLTSLQVVSGTAIWGGGIANAGVLVVTDSYFRDNYSNSNLGGGAIYNSKTLTVTGSTFVKNQSSRGGALFNGGTATLINSTLTQNSATEGSGIHNRGTLTLRNVTAVAGGNLHNWSGKLYLYNSLLANNSAADCYGGGAVAANVNNLIRTGNCGVSITSDPVLGALTAFPSTGTGNEQWVMPLLPGSPALNTGDSATCATTDQRGQPRTGGCDIGAFQSQGFTFTLAGGDNQATLIKSNFTQPLAFTVTAQAAAEPVSGGKVTLTAPGSGASLQSSSQSLTVGSNGTVTTTATANGVTGAYTVTAAIGAANADLALTLTNRSPDLVITKAVTPTSAVGGDLITYTLAFSNTGDLAATNVTMTDTLPSGVTVQGISSGGSVAITHTTSSAGQERFTIATFTAGASGLITLTAEVSGTVTTSDRLTNTATIGWAGAEEDLSDNVASVSNTIPCQPAISVTNGNNSGGGSLRQAIANLCAGGTITFADDTTIYLDSVLTLNNTLSIDGSGHAVTISGDSGHDDDRDVQIFTISASGVVTLSNLSVISGTAEMGGAINNAGALTLAQVTLQDNSATIGGALYNQGAVTLTAVALHSNTATDSGGALYNIGRVTVDSAMLTGNQATNNGTIYNDGTLTVQTITTVR